MEKVLLNNLILCYPPISNQEASWIWQDKSLRDIALQSKLYCLAQRKEIFFENLRHEGQSSNKEKILNSFMKQKRTKLCFSLQLDMISEGHQEKDLKLYIEIDNKELSAGAMALVCFGNKILKIVDSKNNNIIRWWTPDKLLFDFWHGRLKVSGFVNYRKFTRFNLHYVGISKERDSFARLFQNGHKNRSEILSNERQLVPEARLTDELMIFFFEVNDLGITTIGSNDELDDNFLNTLMSGKLIDDDLKIIADAEKALVSILDSEYNEQKYKNYPASKDGLYSENLKRYSYAIAEDITFLTKKSEIVGGYDKLLGFASNKADSIVIEDAKVSLIKGSTL